MIVRTMMSLFAALMLFFAAVPGGRPAAQVATPPPANSTLSDLDDIAQLQRLFAEQAGKPRLLLLLSPT